MEKVPKDPVVEAYKRDLDLSLLRKNLRLTPEERILAAMELQKLAEAARQAGRRREREAIAELESLRDGSPE